MRILFVGDVVGRSGRAVLLDRLPGLIESWKLDLVIVNGENAAGGFGITEAIYQDMIDAGADAITLGNHAWDQREALVFIERAPRLIRPLNYPRGTPGRGAAVIDAKNGARVLAINVMGRIFMDPLDDPFSAVERELVACALKSGADAIVIDVHCEATSEKQAMGYFADGRASLVVGTHTHVPTSDHRILPGGTAFISDVGMTGDYEFDHRHEPRRAAQPLHAQDPGRQVRAGQRAEHVLRGRGRDRRRHRARQKDRRGAPGRQARRDAARRSGAEDLYVSSATWLRLFPVIRGRRVPGTATWGTLPWLRTSIAISRSPSRPISTAGRTSIRSKPPGISAPRSRLASCRRARACSISVAGAWRCRNFLPNGCSYQPCDLVRPRQQDDRLRPQCRRLSERRGG